MWTSASFISQLKCKYCMTNPPTLCPLFIDLDFSPYHHSCHIFSYVLSITRRVLFLNEGTRVCGDNSSADNDGDDSTENVDSYDCMTETTMTLVMTGTNLQWGACTRRPAPLGTPALSRRRWTHPAPWPQTVLTAVVFNRVNNGPVLLNMATKHNISAVCLKG